MPGPHARNAPRIPADASLAESLGFIRPHAGPRLTSAEITALCGEYDAARLVMWRTIGAPLLDALGLAPDAGDDALRAAARRTDEGFKLSRPLATTPEARAALGRAKRLRDRISLACVGLAQAFARAHRGNPDGGAGKLTLAASGDDALMSAVEMILIAVDRFEPERGVRLSTFAAHYARKGVKGARLEAGQISLNDTALERWGQAETAERTLRQRLGREPTVDEVAAHVGGTGQRVDTARAAARALCPVDLGEGEQGPLGAVPDPAPDPEEALAREEERARLRARIDRALPPGTRRRIVAETFSNTGSIEAAGEAIGRRRTTARNALYEAREAVRRELKL